ncbi:MAG: hypothetical protein ACYSUN_14590 [Planctomycetota bacterium]|jgi:hypothetical protein
MEFKKWKTPLLIVAALTLLTVVFAPATPAAEHRLKVHIEEAFEINGAVYEAGWLTLRQVGSYNPTSTINEIWVGRQCLGMLLAVEMPGEPSSASDSLIFDRGADGLLVLTGVSFRNQPARHLYNYNATSRWMAPPHQRSQETHTAVAAAF